MNTEKARAIARNARSARVKRDPSPFAGAFQVGVLVIDAAEQPRIAWNITNDHLDKDGRERVKFALPFPGHVRYYA